MSILYMTGAIVGGMITFTVADKWLDMKQKKPNGQVWRDFEMPVLASSILVGAAAWPVAVPVALVVYNKMNKD